MWFATQKLVFLVLWLSRFAAGQECGMNDFTCQNGSCVNSNQTCDGSMDCEDGSDELDCSPDTLLYFSTRNEIHGMELNSMRLLSSKKTKGYTRTFDVHPKSLQMYWVEMERYKSGKYETFIYAENGDGTSMKLLTHDALYPEDIAVDYVANNLYLTDMKFKEILACRSDGAMCHVLHTDVGAPHSIALDLDSGLMYWSDWDERFAGIYRSGTDGSGRISLVSNHTNRPRSITLDHSAQRLYWVDIGLNTIEFITLDGSLKKVILKSEKYQPFAIALFEDNIYWSEKLTLSLISCNKLSGRNITTVMPTNDLVIKLRLYHSLPKSKASNPCNNVCSDMCLISPQSGYLCVCPNGFKLSKDKRTCVLESLYSAIFVSEESSVFYIRQEFLEKDILTKLPLSLDNTTITRVAFDSNSKYLFVATILESALFAIDLKSNHVEVLAKSEVRYPVDLSFDWSSHNLYWIDSKKGTVEVVNVPRRRIVVLLNSLEKPVALAISPSSGRMFIATSGIKPAIIMYGMDGENRKVLDFLGSAPTALYASKKLLFWADNQKGAIYIANYRDLRRMQILKTEIHGVTSLTADENHVYYTTKGRGIRMFEVGGNLKEDSTRIINFPGQDVVSNYTRISFSPGMKTERSECLKNNGGCSYVCLTSPMGKMCACPSDMLLDKDNRNCIRADDTSCTSEEMWCLSRKMCIPKQYICDGKIDCLDETDEKHCDISTTFSSHLSPIFAGEKGSELIFMAEGPNLFVSVPNATGYHFKSLQYPLGLDARITSLSYDSKSDSIFIANANRPGIYVLSTDLKPSELVVKDITSPKDIDFDWLSNNLYWVDSHKGTVEVISVNNRKRIVILKDLVRPVSIALSPNSGIMFISTIGDEKRITLYGMDGKNERIIQSVEGVPLSLSVHPTKTILYWTDSRAGLIMYANYTGTNSPWILKSGINEVMSIAISEDNVYWTARARTNPSVAGKVFSNELLEKSDQTAWKSVVLSKRQQLSGKSECLNNNGGCSYLCLTSQSGRTCSCSSAMTSENDKKCVKDSGRL